MMTQVWRYPTRLPLLASLFSLTLPLCIIGTLAPLTTTVAQQVTSDGTVSTTVITPDGKNFDINDGTTRGGNLFHSFKEFSVPNGGSANFNNAADVRNIIGRVTGNSVSNIDGLIKTLNPANLFLLNPAGIIFGPNASLNIGGSFLGTTAHSFLFDNGFEFSATNPQAPPLLTINVPIGLGFRDNPANITNQSRALDTSTNIFGLAVRQGNSLTLVGGNVSLDGGILFAPGGRIELGGLSAAGTVRLNSDGSLSFPVGVQRGDVSLTNGAIAYVIGSGGGSIAVNARNLDISGGSRLLAGIGQGLGTAGSQAGDITLDATGEIKVVGTGSYVFNNVRSQATGNGGNINITTGSFSLSDGAQLQASTYGQGNAGNVSVRALGAVELANSAYIFNTVEAGGVGKGGNIDIKAATLSLKNGAQLVTYVAQASANQPSGKRDAGNVTIDVTGPVTIAGVGGRFSSGIFNYVGTGTTGNGGNITISSGSFSLSDGARVEASTYGQGNAGNVTIQAKDAVSFDGVSSNGFPSGVFNLVNSGAKGNSGDINITAGSLSLTGGARLFVSTFGQGDTGKVTIQAKDAVSFDGVSSNRYRSGVFNIVGDKGTGNSDAINITAGSLSLTGGAIINAGTYGQGNAGQVNIDVRDAINIAGFAGFKNIAGNFFPSDIVTAVFEGGKGNGGNVNIKARSLSVSDHARIDPMVYGEGKAGSAFIETKDFVSLSNGYIYSSVFENGVGNGGDINIKTGTLSLTDGAYLRVDTDNRGNTGRVFVEAKDAVYISNARIDSNVGDVDKVGDVQKAVGNSRDIDITTGSLVLTNGGRLTANTYGQGNAGNVRITAKDIIFDGQDSKGNRSGVYSTVQPGGIGNSGNIKITSRSLSITNGARLSASSEGNGSAGNIEVSADSIRLNNQAAIKADTTGGLGNINLRSGDLVLRRGSNITTDATGTATGGNITIDTGVLAALENSDIRANAQDGSGGKITIKTQGLFGLVLRTRADMQRLRPDDLDPNQLSTSDITAISQNNPDLSGTVSIITPDIDPTRGLFELSETVIDPAQQIAQNPCVKGFGSTFTITGRGGFPTDPNKILSSDNVRVDLIQPVPSTVSSTSTTQKQPSQKPPVKKITPARGWIYNEKGQVVLVGYDPTKTGPQREQPAPTSNCAAR